MIRIDSDSTVSDSAFDPEQLLDLLKIAAKKINKPVVRNDDMVLISLDDCALHPEQVAFLETKTEYVFVAEWLSDGEIQVVSPPSMEFKIPVNLAMVPEEPESPKERHMFYDLCLTLPPTIFGITI